MKRLLLLLLLSAAAPIASNAQEFELKISASYPDGAQFMFPVFFGYDIAATDSLQEKDVRWREYYELVPKDTVKLYEQDWPLNTEGPDLLFNNPGKGVYHYNDTTAQIHSKIDIRKKPDSSSFELLYRLFVDPPETGEERVTLLWDRSQIPGIIRHIILAYQNGKTIVDMTQADNVTIYRDSLIRNGSIQEHLKLRLTLYYNRDLPLMSVEEFAASSIRMSAFPNPAVNQSAVVLNLAQPAQISFSVYDVQGREILQQSTFGQAGSNHFNVDRQALGVAAGTYLVRARIEMGTRVEHRSLQLSLQ